MGNNGQKNVAPEEWSISEIMMGACFVRMVVQVACIDE
jgi:hypothetical protein